MTYLESFHLNLDERVVYPYNIVSNLGLENIEFEPITIFYGNNGSGKSTLLNIISERVGVANKTLGNTSEYFDTYVRKCQFSTDLPIPEDSQFIRSEDIMEQIATIRKRNSVIDRQVMGWFEKGLSDKERESNQGLANIKDEFENIFEGGNPNSSFHNHVRATLFQKQDEGSNGETAMQFFKNNLFTDNLYFLDEPENSMAPSFQQELANYITLLAYRLNCQFVIATHSPFMLSMQGAKIYDLDSHPVMTKKWFDLENMKIYFDLFYKNKSKFIK